MRDGRASRILWALVLAAGCGGGGGTPASSSGGSSGAAGTGGRAGAAGGASGAPGSAGAGGSAGASGSGGAGGSAGGAGAAGSAGSAGKGGASGASGAAGVAGAGGAGGTGGAAGMGGAGAGGNAPIPFENHLVLRLETDAADGLQSNGAWKDLSSAAHSITIATGTPQTATTGTAGAKSLAFDGSGPIFQIADAADLRFGATDDFFIVARLTAQPPAGSDGGCMNQYLVSKLGTNHAGPLMFECGLASTTEIHSSLQTGAAELYVNAPTSLAKTFGVVSFGRNLSGTHIESFVGTRSIDTTLDTPVDVSASGSALGIGGLISNGTPSAAWAGKINRLYVFHAPAGTFGAADFAAIRAWVSTAAPLP